MTKQVRLNSGKVDTWTFTSGVVNGRHWCQITSATFGSVKAAGNSKAEANNLAIEKMKRTCRQ